MQEIDTTCHNMSNTIRKFNLNQKRKGSREGEKKRTQENKKEKESNERQDKGGEMKETGQLSGTLLYQNPASES